MKKHFIEAHQLLQSAGQFNPSAVCKRDATTKRERRLIARRKDYDGMKTSRADGFTKPGSMSR